MTKTDTFAQISLKRNKIAKHIKQVLLTSTFSCMVAYATPESKFPINNPAFTQIIKQQQIQQSGLTSLGDVINELALTRGLSQNQFNNNNGDGSTTVNIGNLASNRVLVLLNGNRIATSVNGSYDFTGVPISIVKQIEISRGNPNNKYATDAIAGVINIITNTDFTGIKASSYYGKSSRGDAETQNYALSAGKTTEKSSLFFNAEYSKNTPILAGDRNISALPLFGTGNTRGSLSTPQGRFFLFSPIDFSLVNATTAPGSNGWSTADDPDLIPFNSDLRYNYAPDNYLLTPQERKSIYLNGKYQINDSTKIHADFLFNRRQAQQQLAPQALSFGTSIDRLPGMGFIGIGGDNPYNPYGVDIPGSYIYLIGRRLTEAGNRIFNSNVDSFHFNIGLDGSFGTENNWDWAVEYVNSRRDEVRTGENLVDLRQVQGVLSNACVSDPSCVPLNLFGGEGTITTEMLNAIMTNTRSQSDSNLDVFSAQVNSDIKELPAGALHLNLNYQYRKQSVNKRWDQLDINNNYQGNTDGNTHVNEFSARLAIPLINNDKDQSLSMQLSSRYSKFNFTSGEFSGALGLSYSPINSLKFDLDYSINRRAPSLIALYRDSSIMRSQNVIDPCDNDASLPGCPTGYVASNNEAIPTINFSGNNNLNLEKSESLQFNINYQPENFDGLLLNARVFSQKIENTVSQISGARILRACAYSGDTYCDRITRMDSEPFYATALNTSYANDGVTKTSGLDLSIISTVTTDFADFSIHWQNSYMYESKFSQINDSNGSYITTNFLTLENNRTELPRLKSNLSLGIDKNNWNFNYQIRYVSGFEESCNISQNNIRPNNNPAAAGGVVAEDFSWCTYNTDSNQSTVFNKRHAAGAAFQDINLSYTLSQFQTSVTLGIENIFDKTPPLSVNSTNSYQTYLYNGTGRFYWLRISKEF